MVLASVLCYHALSVVDPKSPTFLFLTYRLSDSNQSTPSPIPNSIKHTICHTKRFTYIDVLVYFNLLKLTVFVIEYLIKYTHLQVINHVFLM